jgi:hypothetical protein
MLSDQLRNTHSFFITPTSHFPLPVQGSKFDFWLRYRCPQSCYTYIASFGHYGCSNARTDHHHPGASKEKDDYHLTSQLSDEAFNTMGMDEKQLLQIDFCRPETIRCVTAGVNFGRVCPNPPPHIWAEYDNWKDNKKNLTKWWRDYTLEKCTEEIDKFAHMGFSERRYYQKHIQLMIEDQTSLFTSLTGTNRSDDSYDGDGDGDGNGDGDVDCRRGGVVSIDGLSDLGSGNEDDALHNRVANEERAAMATVPPNAEQDDREEDAPPPSSSSGWFIS